MLSKANAFSAPRENEKAIEFYKNALDVAKDLQNPLLLGKAHYGLANCRVDEQENYMTAIAYFQTAGHVEFERRAEDCLKGISISKDQASRREELSIGLKTAGEEDSKTQFSLHIEMGYHAPDPDAAISHFGKAIVFAESIAETTKDNMPLMEALKHHSNALAAQRRNQEAEKGFSRLFDLAQKASNLSFLCEAGLGLGNTSSDNDVRIRSYGTAAESSKQLEDKREATYVQIRAHYGMGNARDGKAHFLAVTKLSREIGAESYDTRGLIGYGNALASEGENEASIRYFEDAESRAPTKSLRQKAQQGKKKAMRYL